MPKHYLRTGDVAELLGVDQSAVRLWVTLGLFPNAQHTPGGHARIPLSDVQAVLPRPVARQHALLYLRARDAEQAAARADVLAHLKDYAAQYDYTVRRVVQEVGPGWWEDRPQLDALRAEIQRGAPPYEAIIVESLDRLLLVGGEEFQRWAAPVVRIEEAGIARPELEKLYHRERLLDLYYPLAETLKLPEWSPARVETTLSSGLEQLAEALQLW